MRKLRLLSLLLVVGCSAASQDAGVDVVEREDSAAPVDVVEVVADEDVVVAWAVPDDVPPLVNVLPFVVEREVGAGGPSDAEVDAFTGELCGFFRDSDYLAWLSRYSQGLPDDNAWGEPGYKVWWTNAFATKRDGLVTISWARPSDNSTAKVGRALPPLAGLWLASGDEDARALALGYIRGLSANYDGMVWGDEDLVADTLMARCIFHRDYETELDGGRRIAVDYEGVRYEVIERRHDTVHNPDNPTWGDIYVRNKRSKDDFPYLYRDVPWLVRLVREGDDEEVRNAALKLLRQIRVMAGDIVDNGYVVRTKDGAGVPFIPLTEAGAVDDFACFTTYDALFPVAECTGKMATAYVATGGPLDNDCVDANSVFYGHGGGYEDLAITSHFWSSNMIWGYHLTALALALAFDDAERAALLMEGLVARIEGIMSDARAEQYTEWWPDTAQLLVQAAAYGMPLTDAEARLIQAEYRAAAVWYDATVPWDPWDASVPADVAYPTLPDRFEKDAEGTTVRTYVRPTEILNPFEYCASPLRAQTGAQFVDCERLMDPTRW